MASGCAHHRSRREVWPNPRRESVAGIEVAADWIVGFPGETEQDFQESVRLLERIRFQNSYVFKYSPRPGTDAAALADDVSEEEKKRRNQVLLDAQDRISREKNLARIGQIVEILVEGPSKTNPNRQTGRMDTHQIVHFDAGQDLRGRFVSVEILSATPHSLLARMA